MRRNFSSIRGAGFGRAFQEAAVATPDERQPFAASAPAAPKCDRSGDLGSRHIWRDGAVEGDRCLCGKLGLVILVPCAKCGTKWRRSRLSDDLLCSGCLA